MVFLFNLLMKTFRISVTLFSQLIIITIITKLLPVIVFEKNFVKVFNKSDLFCFSNFLHILLYVLHIHIQIHLRLEKKCLLVFQKIRINVHFLLIIMIRRICFPVGYATQYTNVFIFIMYNVVQCTAKNKFLQ